MSDSSYWDGRWDGPMGNPPGKGPITCTAILLRWLCVKNASREVQQAAIDDWLRDNEPLPVLKFFLERDGFLPQSQ